FVLTTHDDSEAIRKRDASQLFLNHSHCIAKRHTALQAGIDVGDALTVDALNFRRSAAKGCFKQRRYRNNLTVSASYRNVLDVLGVQTIFRTETYSDVVFVTAFAEHRSSTTTDTGLNSSAHLSHRDA